MNGNGENCVDCGSDISNEYGFFQREMQLCLDCFAERLKSNIESQRRLLSFILVDSNVSKKIPPYHVNLAVEKIERRIEFQKKLLDLVEYGSLI